MVFYNFCVVTSRSTSWSVAHPKIFRLFMKGTFDAYVLAKRVQNWIAVAHSTSHGYSVFPLITAEPNKWGTIFLFQTICLSKSRPILKMIFKIIWYIFDEENLCWKFTFHIFLRLCINPREQLQKVLPLIFMKLWIITSMNKLDLLTPEDLYHTALTPL